MFAGKLLSMLTATDDVPVAVPAGYPAAAVTCMVLGPDPGICSGYSGQRMADLPYLSAVWLACTFKAGMRLAPQTCSRETSLVLCGQQVDTSCRTPQIQ